MQIGLSFDEYVDLRLRPGAGADRAFHQAAQRERSHMFPMTTTAASSHLRSRGYDCRPQMLEVLVRDGVVKPAAPDAWAQTDVDAAAEHFEDCDMFTPYAAMCQTLGCRYADFLRPLREAADRESAKYGRRVPDDDQYFVMHRQPPRGGECKPRFIVTDHGCQFWDQFETAVEQRGVTHIRGQAYTSRLNMKVERIFRTMKLWQRLTLLAMNLRSIQKKLTMFRTWYNRHRTHMALGLLTPDEAAAGCQLAEPVAVRAAGEIEPWIKVARENMRGDPRLPIMSIRVKLYRPAA